MAILQSELRAMSNMAFAGGLLLLLALTAAPALSAYTNLVCPIYSASFYQDGELHKLPVSPGDTVRWAIDAKAKLVKLIDDSGPSTPYKATVTENTIRWHISLMDGDESLTRDTLEYVGTQNNGYHVATFRAHCHKMVNKI